MSNFDGNQFQPPSSPERNAGPPRWLFWGVIGLSLLFVGGALAGYVVFNEVLRPSQQERVMNELPFMRAFLRSEPTPMGGVLPTVAATQAGIDPLSLLGAPAETTPSVTPQPLTPTPAATDAPTESAALASATPTATLTPTLTPTVRPSATPPPAATQSAASAQTALVGLNLPDQARNYGFVHHQQTWNNCGPATITMALSYHGWQEDQSVAGAYLKPNREDKNVSPHELVDFVNTQTGVRALMRVGGSIDLLKLLIANEFPVVVETGLMPEAYDWIGHYRNLVGYDDAQGVFYIYDSFLGVGSAGEGVTETYRRLDEDWRHFNRTFIVVYQAQDEGRLLTLLGELSDEQDAAEHALNVAQEEARADRQDGLAWFNMGAAYTQLGQYEEAAAAFDQSRRAGNLPWRLHWYRFEPFRAYYEVGRYDDVLSLVQTNLVHAEELEENYYWQGRVYRARNQTNQALSAFRRALSYNPNHDPSRQQLDALQ